MQPQPTEHAPIASGGQEEGPWRTVVTSSLVDACLVRLLTLPAVARISVGAAIVTERTEISKREINSRAALTMLIFIMIVPR